MIRNPDQKSAILEAGKNGPGKIDVLVESIEDVKSEKDAKRILDLVRPDVRRVVSLMALGFQSLRNF